ncbi:hypothetical protein MTY414_01180 [Mycolicibacterium mageritense]|nr:hypothetical protein MTY414_01180 [Mycolicibacterium mageritense]
MGAHRIHCGDRAKWISDRAPGCRAETTWTPVDPVPITATRRSLVTSSGCHRAVCTICPWKLSMPGMSGTNGWCSTPVAQMTKSAVRVSPSRVVTVHDVVVLS